MLLLKGAKQAKFQKANREKFLTRDQIRTILDTVKRLNRPTSRRDHCAIFLGYHFGLRIGEAAILEHKNFRFFPDEVYVPRLKRAVKSSCACKCGRKIKFSARSAGKSIFCVKCGANVLLNLSGSVDLAPQEVQLNLIEKSVVDYATAYMKDVMRPGQKWLFETWKDQHISESMLSRLFGHYSISAGVPAVYSWHALRHGRGVYIWERFKDLVKVKDALGQKSLSAAEWYVNLSPAQREDALKILDKDAMEMTW